MRVSPALFAGTATLVASAVLLVHARGTPKLASYFTEIPQKVVDPSYAPLGTAPVRNADLNGDGYPPLHCSSLANASTPSGTSETMTFKVTAGQSVKLWVDNLHLTLPSTYTIQVTIQ